MIRFYSVVVKFELKKERCWSRPWTHRWLIRLPSIAFWQTVAEQQVRSAFCEMIYGSFLLSSKSCLYSSITKVTLVCETTVDNSRNASNQGGSNVAAIFCAVNIAQYSCSSASSREGLVTLVDFLVIDLSSLQEFVQSQSDCRTSNYCAMLTAQKMAAMFEPHWFDASLLLFHKLKLLSWCWDIGETYWKAGRCNSSLYKCGTQLVAPPPSAKRRSKASELVTCVFTVDSSNVTLLYM